MIIKNPIFINNSLYNKKYVNKVYFYKFYKPNKYGYDIKLKRDLIWQYYRNRKNKSVSSILENINNNIIKILIIYTDNTQEFIYRKHPQILI
jgi:hypothetical protein